MRRMNPDSNSTARTPRKGAFDAMFLRSALIAAALAMPGIASAQEHPDEHAGHDMGHMDHDPAMPEMAHGHAGGHVHSRPDAHAPIGVMADHTHSKGGFMLAYRIMHMEMGGTQIGSDAIDADTIVTTIPNRFAGMPGQPPTLRVVPKSMRVDMHMLGGMYAPTDWVTLMVMGSYLMKEMPHQTYQGGVGTTVLGSFETSADGFGDTSVLGIFPLVDDASLSLNVNAGVSVPTGSTTETGEVLTPMNMQPTLRLPYPMQLGSGTWDILGGTTMAGHSGEFGWGAQYKAVIHTGTNDQGYRLGDSHSATAWVSYTLAPWVSVSLRGAGKTVGTIHGIDPAIVAPVQTADPDNYGGDRLDAFLGANLLATGGSLRGYRLGLELGLPVYQDLNGPQLKGKWSFMAGVQKAF